MKPQITNITDELPRHKSKHYRTRSLGQIDTLVIHHSATPDTITARSIANYHVTTKDWPGIGYHFVITSDGEILQTNTLETASYHAGGSNNYSIGICLIGNFMDEPPPPQQINAATALIAYLRTQMGPLSLQPHRKLNQTACPGATWESWFPELDEPIEEPPICSSDLAHLYEELVQNANALQRNIMELGELIPIAE